MTSFPMTKAAWNAVSPVNRPASVTDKIVVVGEQANRLGAILENLAPEYAFSVSVKNFGAKADGVTDDTDAIQAAIDYANSLYLGGSIGGGGAVVILPAGRIVFTGVVIKEGVSIKGQGINTSVLLLAGATSTGFKCEAEATGSYEDQVSWGFFEDFGVWSNEATPTGQVMWSAIGFSRWTVKNVFFEWFDGCKAIEVIGSILAGSGGPAQWYNSFYDCHFLCPASRPADGVAMDLGDTAAGFEQVTTWAFFGGRVSASVTGTGLKLRGTGCDFHGFTFEGLAVACELGSDGTRGAASNSFFGCYFEANTVNREIKANAAGSMFSGTLVTGGAENDNGTKTVFFETGVFQGYAGNAGSEKWEVKIANGSSRRPVFKGSTFPAIGIENAAGNEAVIANNSSGSSAASYFSFLTDGLTDILFEFGLFAAKLKADHLNLQNDADFGVYSGAGTPEGVVGAKVGSIYLRTNGGANTSLYVKESGALATGWVAK